MRPSHLIFTVAQSTFIRVNTMQNQLRLLQCDISAFVMLRCSYSVRLAHIERCKGNRASSPGLNPKGGHP